MPDEKHHVWKADWVLTPRTVQLLIETAFPVLAPVSIAEFGSGWDNTVFLVNDSFVFRFPRRQIAVSLMETEIRLLPWLANRLPLPTPNPCHGGFPSAHYPNVFAGYPLLPGHTITALKMTDEERRRIAAPLGQFLAVLHSLPSDQARMHGASEDPIRRLDARLHNTRAVERLNAFTADAMPRVLQDRIAFFLENLPALEQPSTERSFMEIYTAVRSWLRKTDADLLVLSIGATCTLAIRPLILPPSILSCRGIAMTCSSRNMAQSIPCRGLPQKAGPSDIRLRSSHKL